MDVALLHWPSADYSRIQLARQGRPRLLLVEPDAEPPVCVDELEDWVRLPASPADRNARISALEERAVRGGDELPVVSRDSTLEYRGETIQLTPTQARVISPLIDRFGAVVSREALVAHVWPGSEGAANNLDVTIGRLRRRIDDAGLSVRTIRSRGYLLVDADGD